SPTVVLFYQSPCPISQTSPQVFITQQTNHRLSKIVGRVSQNEIFARLDWQTLGTHGCRNDGFSHRHCFKNFKPSASADAQGHNANRTPRQERSYVLHPARQLKALFPLGCSPQFARRVPSNNFESHFGAFLLDQGKNG